MWFPDICYQPCTDLCFKPISPSFPELSLALALRDLLNSSSKLALPITFVVQQTLCITPQPSQLQTKEPLQCLHTNWLLHSRVIVIAFFCLLTSLHPSCDADTWAAPDSQCVREIRFSFSLLPKKKMKKTTKWDKWKLHYAPYRGQFYILNTTVISLVAVLVSLVLWVALSQARFTVGDILSMWYLLGALVASAHVGCFLSQAA